MDRGFFVRQACRTIVMLTGCASLGACGAAGTSGFEATQGSTSTLGAIGSKLGNLVAFNKLFPDSAPLPQSEATIECPFVEVQDGTASARFYRGGSQSNTDVSYAFALGDVARECSKVGNQLQLKVGVEGRVLIGPAGTPGTFSVPLRIAVRNDASQKAVSSQVARISASVAPNDTQGGFTYVTEPFAVPLVANPGDDYTILVGFDTGAKGAAPATPRRRKARG